MKTLLVVWLAAFSTSAHGYVALEGMEGGACINAKLLDSFDINKFQGVWYEAQSAPNMFQLTKKCNRMEYIWNGNVVKATTTGLGEEDQPTEQSTDMTQSARNVARFLIRPPEAPDIEVPFDILSTDYKSYACVYSCLKYENFKSEFTWALTRDNTKLTGAGAICQRVFQKNNIDSSKMVDTYHGALCNAPPKTTSGGKRKSGLPPYKGNTQTTNKSNTKTDVKTSDNKNSKEKKRKYNWTPNKSSWKPYMPRTKQKTNNEVNYSAQKPYKGYGSGNQATVTNVQSTIKKTIPSKPIQSVGVKTENNGNNPYTGYRSTKEKKKDKPVVTKVQSPSQKKSPYRPIKSVGIKPVNKQYNPYVGYGRTKEETNDKPTVTKLVGTSRNRTPYKPIQSAKGKKENTGYNPYIGFRSTIVKNTDKRKENEKEVAEKSIKDAEVKTENKQDQLYVGYRGNKRVDTNKSDKSKKDTANNISIYKELKNSDEETLIPKSNKVYRSNWGTTYGVRRLNAWGDSTKQNDDASQVEKVRPSRGYRKWEAKKPKQKERNTAYQPRKQPRRNWSTIESIKVGEAAVSGCKDSDKSCGYWATSGECEKNPLWMNSNCQKSCGKCDKSSRPSKRSSSSLYISRSPCSDKNSGCQGWAAMGECKKNPGWMNLNCQQSCGRCS